MRALIRISVFSNYNSYGYNSIDCGTSDVVIVQYRYSCSSSHRKYYYTTPVFHNNIYIINYSCLMANENRILYLSSL